MSRLMHVIVWTRLLAKTEGCPGLEEEGKDVKLCPAGPARTIFLVSVLGAYHVMQSAGEWLRQDALWHDTAGTWLVWGVLQGYILVKILWISLVKFWAVKFIFVRYGVNKSYGVLDVFSQ